MGPGNMTEQQFCFNRKHKNENTYCVNAIESEFYIWNDFFFHFSLFLLFFMSHA